MTDNQEHQDEDSITRRAREVAPDIVTRVEAINPQAKAERLRIAREDTSLSADLRFVLENLFSHTGGMFEQASLNKARIANTLRPLVNDFPPDAQTIYLGSGVDIYFPLALGGRQIILVDTDFIQKEIDDQLINFNPKAGNGSIKMDFDFGKGKEEVNITLQAMNAKDFKVSGKIGVLFAFLGSEETTPFFKPNLFDSIIMGGLIFDNRYDLPAEVLEDLKDYGLEAINIDGYEGKIYKKISPNMTKLKEALEKAKEKDEKKRTEIFTKMPHSNLTPEELEKLGWIAKPGEFWEEPEKNDFNFIYIFE